LKKKNAYNNKLAVKPKHKLSAVEHHSPLLKLSSLSDLQIWQTVRLCFPAYKGNPIIKQTPGMTDAGFVGIIGNVP
jgi:hypothetical protein